MVVSPWGVRGRCFGSLVFTKLHTFYTHIGPPPFLLRGINESYVPAGGVLGRIDRIAARCGSIWFQITGKGVRNLEVAKVAPSLLSRICMCTAGILIPPLKSRQVYTSIEILYLAWGHSVYHTSQRVSRHATASSGDTRRPALRGGAVHRRYQLPRATIYRSPGDSGTR